MVYQQLHHAFGLNQYWKTSAGSGTWMQEQLCHSAINFNKNTYKETIRFSGRLASNNIKGTTVEKIHSIPAVIQVLNYLMLVVSYVLCILRKLSYR